MKRYKRVASTSYEPYVEYVFVSFPANTMRTFDEGEDEGAVPVAAPEATPAPETPETPAM